VERCKRRRSFPEVFKLEAVAAARGARSVSRVSAEPGLPVSDIMGWGCETRSSAREGGRAGRCPAGAG
jgi:transposase